MSLKAKKIINDPVYGFVSIKSELIYQLVQHPYFQRLRRIKQLGLTEYVYPGALHTRFHHAIGAMHLMGLALDSLRGKGVMIFEEEYESALIAILLHDLGHGPFSHALETTILQNVHHEELSLLLMEQLNQEFNGQLTPAILMFRGKYHRRFFYQLISSQLDMDRLDYLQRDFFYTGVREGSIGADRIIRMLNVHDDQIVVEEKGVYSIEHFLNARRLMYWQVYLHKTTVSTEQMLIQLIRRAKLVFQKDPNLFCTPSLKVFLKEDVTTEDFRQQPNHYLTAYTRLDDHDIWGSLKAWQEHSDPVLGYLCRALLERKLFRTEFLSGPASAQLLGKINSAIKEEFGFSSEDATSLFAHGSISNAAYLPDNQQIMVKTKRGELLDIRKASDLPHLEALGKIVKKFYLCHPKSLPLRNF